MTAYTSMEINLQFVHAGNIGYGRMGVELAKSLTRMGVEVYDHLKGTRTDDLDRREGLCNSVCWLSVPSHARTWWEGQHNSVLTMWEATRLPESFRENIDQFDLVMVPSEHNRELFSQYHPNVVKVPLGIDPEVWKPTRRTPPVLFFDFLVGGSGPRKGIDLAYDAFHKAFPDGSWGEGPIPRLTMKSPKGGDFAGSRVQLVSGYLPPEDEVALYESAHVYLQPSRGEGWGLQPLQAVAQGCPTILTDAHGHAEFAYLGVPLQSKLVPAAYFSQGHAGEWWEPDFDQLVDEMRHAYEDYDKAAERAWFNAHIATEHFTWDRTAARLVGTIGEENLTPYSGPGRMVEAKLRLYNVQVDRPWKAEIAGVSYAFEPGRDYYEPADVKRHMFDAGVLDPACLNPDGLEDAGLNEQQVALLKDYTAAHAYCPSCRQRLNTAPTRADDYYAETLR